jgi:predicted SnoaL-like aldol condensation-catalyzing enzyme
MANNSSKIVLQAIGELFGNKDIGAVDRYFGPSYIQHNPVVADGIDGLKEVATAVAAAQSFNVTTYRVIEDGDLTALHSIYEGFGPEPLVAFDIFRVADGRIVEHWDAMAPIMPPNPSGRSQVDGRSEISDRDHTAANREVVTNFVTTVLIGGQYDQLPRFIDGERYAQHNSAIADGLSGLGQAVEDLAKQGIKMAYATLHRVVAEGNFVLTQSEGAFGSQPTAYYDLFRVEAGKIVEHWDVLQPIPAEGDARNPNGMF